MLLDLLGILYTNQKEPFCSSHPPSLVTGGHPRSVSGCVMALPISLPAPPPAQLAVTSLQLNNSLLSMLSHNLT